MEAQCWGEQSPVVLLTYLNAGDHFLTPRPVEEASAHTLDPIPVAVILAVRDAVLATVSLVAAGANTDLPVPCPSI